MPTQIAQLELRAHAAPQAAQQHLVTDETQPAERPFIVARGIINAVLIAIPFWVLFAIAIYLMV